MLNISVVVVLLVRGDGATSFYFGEMVRGIFLKKLITISYKNSLNAMSILRLNNSITNFVLVKLLLFFSILKLYSTSLYYSIQPI